MAATAAATPVRERLLDAALLSFSREGTLAATLEEIRGEAGVSVGALYHHFADKRALAGALYLRTLAEFQEGFCAMLEGRTDAEAGVRAAVDHLVRWCRAHPAQARMLFDGREAADPKALQALNRDFFARTMRWYDTHVHYGVLRPLPGRLAAALWLGPTFDYLRQGQGRIDPTVRRTLADAAWQTLRKEQ